MPDKSKNIAFYLLISLLVLGSFWFIHLYGVDVPHWDDHAVRNYVSNFSWSDFLDLISFHNEHRIGVTRFFALIVDFFEGRLNYKALMYIGQFALVGVLGLYVYIKEKFDISSLLLFLIALAIFNLSTFENSLWGMAGLQNHWVLFLTPLALVLIIKSQLEEDEKQLWFYGALMTSTLAILSSANGILVAPIGVLLLFFIGNRKPLLIWSLVQIVLVTLYFIGFQSFGMSQRPHLEDFFLNLFALAGSFATPVMNIEAPMGFTQVAGLINILLALLLFFRLLFKKHNQHQFLLYIALTSFYIGTMVLISVSRSDYERHVLLTSKYKIYSLLLLANTLFFGIQKEKINGFNLSFGLTLGLALLAFCNLQFSFLDDAKATYRERLADQVNLELQGVDYLKNDNLIAKAIASQSFSIEKSRIDSIALQKEYIEFFEDDLPQNGQNFVFARSKSQSQLIPFNPDYRFFSSQESGAARLYLYNFPSDVYELYFISQQEGQINVFNPEKTLRIEGISYTNAPKNW
ncbi:hypothetical protein [Jiulongibacter sp. NS-SX5]|uniref:hypothetical protein n=1 Tax=Jiulongibacter sp. NS-SX5 TaxID=3463854 RepID=UPI0040598F3D